MEGSMSEKIKKSKKTNGKNQSVADESAKSHSAIQEAGRFAQNTVRDSILKESGKKAASHTAKAAFGAATGKKAADRATDAPAARPGKTTARAEAPRAGGSGSGASVAGKILKGTAKIAGGLAGAVLGEMIFPPELGDGTIEKKHAKQKAAEEARRKKEWDERYQRESKQYQEARERDKAMEDLVLGKSRPPAKRETPKPQPQPAPSRSYTQEEINAMRGRPKITIPD